MNGFVARRKTHNLGQNTVLVCVVMNVVCKFLDYRVSMCLAKWPGVSC